MSVRVLVVDDEPTILRTIQVALEAVGLTVRTAATGVEAQTLLTQAPPDLVLLDIRLKETDGLALLRWIRTQHPSLGVLVITGYDTDESERAVQALGVLGIIRKPIPLPELQQQVLAVTKSMGS